MTITTGETGRLPSREIAWPISRDAFTCLARQWRAAHLWLSLWNPRGEVIEIDSQAGRFWSALWDGGQRLRDEMAALARAACETAADDASIARTRSVDLWRPDLAIIAVPIRSRLRPVGAVLAALLLRDQPGEALMRLCSQCACDGEFMKQAAMQFGVVKPADEPLFISLLRAAVDQIRESEAAREEAAVLSHNLESTYEELHLIYRISGMVGLPQRPLDVLKRVGLELLEVSRASGVAVVLSEHDASHCGQGATGRSAQQPGERIVQVGRGAATVYELERLAESLDIDPGARTPHILLNQIGRRPEFRWAQSWLKHFVALPLWHDKQLLGVLLAINCNDAGDYTSVDVQLFRAVADRLTAFLENQRLYDDLAELLLGLLHALVNSIDAKDTYTCGHSERVAHISRALAQAAQLTPVECERVYLSGLMHDVGKIGVPDAVLCKPGKLSREEFDAMKRHPEVGSKILSRVRQVADLMPGVLCHHERIDGRGYPHGLAGRAIPLLGRLICLADCFDAMTTNRTYRAALPLPTVVAEIRRCSGTQFDPELAELFLGMDLRQVMNDARDFAGGDPNIGRIGAFSAAMKIGQRTLSAPAN